MDQDKNEMTDLERLLEAADLEQQVSPGESVQARATRILEDGATVAAMSIVQLSRQATNEGLRFRAATYLLDRVLGDSKAGIGTGKAPWEDVLGEITVPNDASALDS